MSDKRAIRLPYLPKPAWGQPCNGCGYCCAQQVCQIGEQLLGGPTPGPCPLLIYRAGRTWCGAVEVADAVSSPEISAWLGIGKGCCSDDPEPEGEEEPARPEAIEV